MFFYERLVVNLVVLLVLSGFDIKYRIVPNYISIPYIVFAFIFLLLDNSKVIYVLSFLEALAIILVIWWYSKIKDVSMFDVFGGGDIKVLIGFSLMNDLQIFNLTILTGSVLGIVFSLLRKENGVPFVPFLFFGYIVSLIIKFFIFPSLF